MLSAARLVSLVGPGGVGKTRLAVRLATDLARGFAGGGWWVSLAEVRRTRTGGCGADDRHWTCTTRKGQTQPSS